MNITNQTPLAGVKLFQSSTYPQSIDLYWRDHSPIIFELSDCPDRGDAYPHFLDYVSSQLKVFEAALLTKPDERILCAKAEIGGRSFYVVQDDDTVTLTVTKPIFSDDYTVDTPHLFQASALLATIYEAVLAVTFSPVDLAWLLGEQGRLVGLYDSKIWGAAACRLPDDLLFGPEGYDCGDLTAPEVVANDVHPCCA